MPLNQTISVSKLSLDLTNFRTVPQKDEASTLQALISIHPEWFWALTNSLLDDGYLPTENVIVLRQEELVALVVKEGNRRIAALKFIAGDLSLDGTAVPEDITEKIANLSDEWKAANTSVPCAVYGSGEAALVDRVVTLTHGKGEQAGRDKWNAVARARHNRDKNGVLAPGLDLLEKYLQIGGNVTNNWRQRWSGDYPVTVLEELLKRNAERFGFETARDLATGYPTIEALDALEDIIRDIGLGMLGFHEVRFTNALEDIYGIAPVEISKDSGTTGTPTDAGTTSTPTDTSAAGTTTSQGAASKAAKPKKTRAAATNDPTSVIRILKHFHPVGLGREKVVTLLKEARKLRLKDHPHAFCFVLRCMFELSAKAFCADQAAKGGPPATKNDGNDKNLQPLLLEIIKYLSGPEPGDQGKKTPQEKAMTKLLHGPKVELESAGGVLSITSMNQLVHGPTFTLDAQHISTVFGNVFPLLDVLNQ